jgi:hypothetical protein
MNQDHPQLHCWADWDTIHPFGTKYWKKYANHGGAVCLLPYQHNGPHQFIPYDQITIKWNNGKSPVSVP